MAPVHPPTSRRTSSAAREAAGIAPALSGIVASTDDDEARLARGGQLLDNLHRHFSSRA